MAAIDPSQSQSASAPSVERAVALLDHRRQVRIWLYCVAAALIVLVLVGGATRLTDSGLSITEWDPVQGVIPPLSEAAWTESFDKYRQTPEYRQINSGMELSEFKIIYWWEWGHRFLARFIGLVFAVPLAFFWVTGRIEPFLKPRLLAILGLGALQGAVGWWMVASGLTERTDVSQYRLAVHLTLACLLFAAIIWVARGLVRRSQHVAMLSGQGVFAGAIVALVFVQIYLGGLVAGLDAGLSFNTWPLMDGALVPSGLMAIEPAWRNLFENVMTVQFIHRSSAYCLWAAVLLHMGMIVYRASSSVQARRAVVLFALVTAQAVVGILALLTQIQTGWALAHQFGALLVLGYAVIHWRGFFPAYPLEMEPV